LAEAMVVVKYQSMNRITKATNITRVLGRKGCSGNLLFRLIIEHHNKNFKTPTALNV